MLEDWGEQLSGSIGRPSDFQTNLRSWVEGIDTYSTFAKCKGGICIEPESSMLQLRFPIGYPLQREPIS